MSPEKKRSVQVADPSAGYRAHAADVDAAIRRVLDSGRFILGAEVESFEREWADFCGAADCVAVASGTDAIELGLRAIGVGAGDVVVTVPNTVTATVAAIERSGAQVALSEIDPATFTLDVSALQEWLARTGAPRISAVVPVHLYGHPVDLPALLQLGEKFGFAVVEDAAQAHGARIAGRSVGTFGKAAAFSFYPTKNLGALGDAGAVVVQDGAVAERVRHLRQYGWRERYVADVIGVNSRMDEIQAAVLRARLPHLVSENRRRADIAARYRAGLQGWRFPEVHAGCEVAWHQFVIRHSERDRLRGHLENRGISCAVLYPSPIHHQPAYRGRLLLHPAGLHQAERACAEVLSLPVHPQVEDGDVTRIIEALLEFGRGVVE